jgi:hypothetical protein
MLIMMTDVFGASLGVGDIGADSQIIEDFLGERLLQLEPWIQ